MSEETQAVDEIIRQEERILEIRHKLEKEESLWELAQAFNLDTWRIEQRIEEFSSELFDLMKGNTE